MVRAVAAAVVAVAALALTACGGGGTRTDVVIVNAGEPQNPLIPTNTNDTNGGRVIDRLFAGLMSYDANGTPSPEVAQSIETTDNINYRITLKPGWTFTDGSPVTAHSFVDAWNYGALSSNAQLQQSLFSPIAGFDDVAAAEPTAHTMSGLRVIDDHHFTVRLKAPTIDFKLRLGFSAFYPLPKVAFADMAAFGQHPIGNGPYQLAGEHPWLHNVKIELTPNPRYHGNRMPQNKGLRFVLYANLDTAYADLLSSNLDVLDSIPPSVLPVYRKDLGDRAITAPAASNQTLDTPLRLPHFGGEEGRLRQLALSAAINRPQICRQIFSGARTPAREFTASSLPGYDADIDGNEALDFDPDRARQLWSQADAISKWNGQYAISYNADGGHQEWVDAVANSIKNVLGIDAVGAPQPTFAGFRTQITSRSIATAFRAGWQGDYPSLLSFLQPLFVTGAGANDVGYSNPRFDAALSDAAAAPSVAESHALANQAQRILLRDMPVIPLWYTVSVAGRSPAVSNVTLTWNGLPDYEHIIKA
ncbi:peptide ABC transporter substrate-binding protein [Mycobacterium shimoidei]|uniref:peptide ABC transporter substrate-binding protein n=1 Tax=Mycobacterium shimoidei TaxID=29313 RepID=UPI000849046F|nr:ABC transporter substrate-binding protein [Mycobacterium shimoidei]MCV7259566.1 ABC transporter substrate-binding protein [Mycobacterium shimoidei]ODR14577.1 ABC transporter substrate-binding protein [Mycobacterium shimoidei]ORW80943.1 ABC transporter substrate-binding protein [Mycobacterium shimoidei]